MGAGQDAHAYWRAVRVLPVRQDAGDFGAYLYSPAFVQILDPILSLRWEQFLAVWAGLLMVALLVLTGPVLFVFALPVAFFEIWGGNIHLLLALAIVARLPLARDVGIRAADQGHAGHRPAVVRARRREWRKLAIALGTTAAIVGVSLFIDAEPVARMD